MFAFRLPRSRGARPGTAGRRGDTRGGYRAPGHPQKRRRSFVRGGPSPGDDRVVVASTPGESPYLEARSATGPRVLFSWLVRILAAKGTIIPRGPSPTRRNLPYYTGPPRSSITQLT